MIDKLLMVTACLALWGVGFLMLPYLLWLAWGRIILLKKELIGLDFDYRGSK